MMWAVRVFLAVAATVSSVPVSATPQGVPKRACVSMSPAGPGHQQALAQSSPLPYHVTLESGSGTGTVRLTISQSPEGLSFKGFMVQARAAHSDTPLGIFQTEDDQAKTISCTSDGDTASHVNEKSKSSVSVIWIPPTQYSGTISFFVSVVNIPSIFWVKEEAGTISF